VSAFCLRALRESMARHVELLCWIARHRCCPAFRRTDGVPLRTACMHASVAMYSLIHRW
jgi:hypothetical protein